MTFYVLTLFPEMVLEPLRFSVMGKALEKGVVRVKALNVRDYARDKHKMTDDYPYGGGQGMVMKPEPLVGTIRSVLSEDPRAWVVLLSPQGIPFTQKAAHRLSGFRTVALVCGRYEGVDERVRGFVNEEVSVGDYVLSGGELAALIVIEAVTRLLPGALHAPESAQEESFSGGMLEYPQYTRPAVFEGKAVPEILLSGNHQKIRQWRRKEALLRTWIRRPDLIRAQELSESERRLLEQLQDDP
ncbi:MAG: tRNA (guanosine(37)-N1)-methyltransferase TrmD [Deltaproteobacteria bacterium]|nr:MAG: tRNA (guanosine(37)-N1)-methyltransferase TrmD [Deltaproteobacteria bacterium]